MRAVGRRGLVGGLIVLVALALALAASAGVSSPDGPESADVAEEQAPDLTPSYRFLSSPDFMNADVADISGLPGFRARTPNSWNASYAVAVDRVMDAFASEQPEDVLVAGDLVNGHWGRDARGSGVFGPVRTESQRRAAVVRAASAYYGAWRRLFEERDLPVHVAVGDHEVGDNDWKGSAANDFKRRSIDLFKQQFAQRVLRPRQYGSRPPGPANRTAYATRLAPEVQLVTVDVFERTRGDVVPRLDAQQLRWLDRVLDRANDDGVDWTIVQGHVPVVGPVRQRSSSGLSYRQGARSDFWRTMARHGVDLYLSGEVHDITAIQRNGVTQISHGGLFGHSGRDGRGGTNYLVGDVDGDRLSLTSKRFRVLGTRGGQRLWQTTDQGRPPLRKRFAPEADEVGSMLLSSDGTIRSRAGTLAEYTPRR